MRVGGVGILIYRDQLLKIKLYNEINWIVFLQTEGEKCRIVQNIDILIIKRILYELLSDVIL